jgi:hypothetical protein
LVVTLENAKDCKNGNPVNMAGQAKERKGESEKREN